MEGWQYEFILKNLRKKISQCENIRFNGETEATAIEGEVTGTLLGHVQL